VHGTGFAAQASADSNTAHYVKIQNHTRCDVEPDRVICEASFAQAPMADASSGCAGCGRDTDVTVTSAGALTWQYGNIGGPEAVVENLALIPGQTYHMWGWTIVPTGEATTFTNDATGHGLTVSKGNGRGSQGQLSPRRLHGRVWASTISRAFGVYTR
jgi:hypothetical protein